MRFADILRQHWSDYVARAAHPIPARHWRAVEAVLSCQTPRRGGHRHRCSHCQRDHYFFHSCNHRSCPRCGARAQRQWSAKQESRLLPLPYYLITITLPDPLRRLLALHPSELYPLFFEQSVAAVKALCANPRYLGAETGFIAVLHTWSRRLLYHPHLHLLVPALGVRNGGCALIHPRHEEYFIPERALARQVRAHLETALQSAFPDLAKRVDLSRSSQHFVVQCKEVGRGRSALRYLAAYVAKSALNEKRLIGYDSQGRILLRYKDNAGNKWKTELLEPLELIRRWLLHVLPKGLVRVRHYGWLSPAANKTLRRIRFLLGLRPRPVRALADLPLLCPSCQAPLQFVASIAPVRGPPLSRTAAFLRAP